MVALHNIEGQQFYYSTIIQVVEKCSQKEKCALIVDEIYLNELLTKGINIIGKCVNQIIIIGDNINSVQQQLSDKNILLIAADTSVQAIQYAILSAELNEEIICIPKEDEKTTSEIIELIML